MKFRKIPRANVPPEGFEQATWLQPDASKLQYVSAPPYSPPKHRVKLMYRFKARLLKWGIGILTSIPEEMIWEFLTEIVARIQARIDRLPKQALVGQAPANASEHINASARLLFRLMSHQDAMRLSAEQTVDVATGLPVSVNDLIVGVHNGSRMASQAKQSDIPALTDSTSFLQATALDPKYYFTDGSLYVVPASADARAYVLSVAAIDPATETVISWLPMELEEAAILRAAILELQDLLNTDLAGLSFDYANFITTYKPSTPAISNLSAGAISASSAAAGVAAQQKATAAAADDIQTDINNNATGGALPTASASSATASSASAPTAAKTASPSLTALGAFPTATISANVGTLISDIVAGRADMDAIIARIKLATEDVDTPTPATGNDAYSDVTLTYSLDPSGLSAGTSGTDQDFIPLLDAPTAITEEVLTDFDGIITEITNRLAGADDVEVASALTAQARTVVEKYATQVRENVETYRLRMEGFKTQLERAIQNAQFGLRDRELDITDKNATIAGIQAETQRKQLELSAEQTKVARNQIRSQDRQAEIQGVATNIRSANETIQSLISQYQTDVQKATAEFQGTLREYDAGLQLAISKFNADVQAELQDAQAALQTALQNAQLATQVSSQDAQLATQAALQNAQLATQSTLQDKQTLASAILQEARGRIEALLQDGQLGAQAALQDAAQATQAAIQQAQNELQEAVQTYVARYAETPVENN